MSEDKLEALVAAEKARKERRAEELRAAFRDMNALTEQIVKDCAHLIAGVGGYIVPLERGVWEAWVEERMHTDAMFAAKVHVATALLLEYVEAALEGREPPW